MSVVVKIDRFAIVVPSFQAAALAGILEGAKLYEREGYRADAPWKLCTEQPLAVTFSDNAEFVPMSATVRKVYDDAEKTNTRWLDEYNKRNAAERRAMELETELAAIKALRPCAMAPAEESTTEGDGGSATESTEQ